MGSKRPSRHESFEALNENTKKKLLERQQKEEGAKNEVFQRNFKSKFDTEKDQCERKR